MEFQAIPVQNTDIIYMVQICFTPLKMAYQRFNVLVRKDTSDTTTSSLF